MGPGGTGSPGPPGPPGPPGFSSPACSRLDSNAGPDSRPDGREDIRPDIAHQAVLCLSTADCAPPRCCVCQTLDPIRTLIRNIVFFLFSFDCCYGSNRSRSRFSGHSPDQIAPWVTAQTRSRHIRAAQCWDGAAQWTVQ